mmetsp:Transcript_36798/g.92223  ORF Transcript_36798/g.92223 Transcript_36798/m.92223 type:complete len:469 (+) Transcript_36798:792-2198(+)
MVTWAASVLWRTISSLQSTRMRALWGHSQSPSSLQRAGTDSRGLFLQADPAWEAMGCLAPLSRMDGCLTLLARLQPAGRRQGTENFGEGKGLKNLDFTHPRSSKHVPAQLAIPRDTHAAHVVFCVDARNIPQRLHVLPDACEVPAGWPVHGRKHARPDRQTGAKPKYNKSWRGERRSHVLDDLHNIFVVQHVLLADLLWVVLSAGAPHKSVFKVLDDALVDAVTELLHCGVVSSDDHGCIIVGDLALGLGVYANQVQVLPHHFQQIVKVPLHVSGDGTIVGHAVDDVKLLHTDLVDLVENVHTGNVHPISFNNVNEIVCSDVGVSQNDVSVMNLVFAENALDGLQIKMGRRLREGKVDTTLLLFLKCEVRWFLIQANPKSFQFPLNNPFVCQGLHRVKNNENQTASSCHCNDLSTSTLSVFCTFNDSGKIKQLNLCSFVVDDSWNACQGCEFVGSNLGEGTRELGQEG